jgi:hypothetical protein
VTVWSSSGRSMRGKANATAPMKPRSLPSEVQRLVKGNLPSLVLVTGLYDMASELG